MDAETLKKFVKPDESLREYLSRCSYDHFETSVPFLDTIPLFPRNKVEIYGPSSSGKTEILCQVNQIRNSSYICVKLIFILGCIIAVVTQSLEWNTI